MPVATAPARPRRRLRLHQRIPAAALKGAVLAAAVVGVIVGVVPAEMWWLSDWHWAGAFMLVAGLAALAGFDTGLLAVGMIAAVQAIGSLPANMPLAAGLAATVLLARILWEVVLAAAVG